MLFVLGLPHDDLVPPKVHDPIGSGMAHLAIVEELMVLEDTVASLPGLDSVPLLVHPAMAVRVLDGQSTETDVVRRSTEVDRLL